MKHFVTHPRLTLPQNDMHNVNCLLYSLSATLIILDTIPATLTSLWLYMIITLKWSWNIVFWNEIFCELALVLAMTSILGLVFFPSSFEKTIWIKLSIRYSCIINWVDNVSWPPLRVPKMAHSLKRLSWKNFSSSKSSSINLIGVRITVIKGKYFETLVTHRLI